MAEVEHLKLIQAIITRLAGNSFLIKGWTVTLTAGLTALSKAQSDRSFAWIAAGVVVVFALLDAFYLASERSYRKLYEQTAADAPSVESWSLKAGKVGPAEVARAVASFAVWPLHAAALTGALVLALSA